jgi:hypothetical protein
MNLLTTEHYEKELGLSDRGQILDLSSPLEYPGLRHLTFALTSRYLSDCRLEVSNLTSLHIALDQFSFQRVQFKFQPEFQPKFFPGFVPGLRRCIISSNMGPNSRMELFECVKLLLWRIKTVPLLIIRDIMLGLDGGEDDYDLGDRGRIELLVFENVGYSVMDKIPLSGRGTIKDLDEKCKAYIQLRKYANECRIINEDLPPLLMWQPPPGYEEQM